MIEKKRPAPPNLEGTEKAINSFTTKRLDGIEIHIGEGPEKPRITASKCKNNRSLAFGCVVKDSSC